jgi:hypothetical protein
MRNTKAGIWVDHSRAVIVIHGGPKQGIRMIESNLTKHTRSSGGSRYGGIGGLPGVTPDTHRERHRSQQIKSYYARIVSLIKDIDRILILGPGVAKVELYKEIGDSHIKGSIIGIQPADRMTETELVAKVRDFFKSHRPAA